ncbi:hypothetical protein JCM1393_22940 [Clostridium carnis]
MRINPVLRNESKLTVRTPRFTLMIFAYIAILSIGVLVFYKAFNDTVYTNGLDLYQSIILYIGMAIGQAVLLMFIVPSLTSTAICSEREKQTLDILLSSKLTPLQIIIGKVLSSSLKVVMLIVCTMPLYAICGLIGGVTISNILKLIIFFIINTIFVGSIGVFISTYIKTSKVATAITYGIVLFIYLGTLIIAWVIFLLAMAKINGQVQVSPPQVSMIVYLSPVTGFLGMLTSQVGSLGNFSYMIDSFGLSIYAEYISIGIQLVLSGIFIYLASIKLNPLNTARIFKRKKKVREK